MYFQRPMAAALCLGLMALLLPATWAAPPAGKKPTPAQADNFADDAAQEKAQEKKAQPTRRLPPYFNKLVNDAQRKQIYELQAAYAPRIDELEAQLQALRGELNTRCENVLSIEQRQQLAVLRAEAKAKRAAAQLAQEAADDEAAAGDGEDAGGK